MVVHHDRLARARSTWRSRNASSRRAIAMTRAPDRSGQLRTTAPRNPMPMTATVSSGLEPASSGHVERAAERLAGKRHARQLGRQRTRLRRGATLTRSARPRAVNSATGVADARSDARRAPTASTVPHASCPGDARGQRVLEPRPSFPHRERPTRRRRSRPRSTSTSPAPGRRQRGGTISIVLGAGDHGATSGRRHQSPSAIGDGGCAARPASGAAGPHLRPRRPSGAQPVAAANRCGVRHVPTLVADPPIVRTARPAAALRVARSWSTARAG